MKIKTLARETFCRGGRSAAFTRIGKKCATNKSRMLFSGKIIYIPAPFNPNYKYFHPKNKSMIYSNSDVRRQDRLLDEKSAQSLLKTGEYGVLSVLCNDTGVYGLPVSYVWDDEKSLYLHCATEGRKLKCIDSNNSVSFCVVGKTNVIPDEFTTEYESIILECRAHRNLAEEERMSALTLFVEKYSRGERMAGLEYARKLSGITEIIRLDIIKWSGKRKRVDKEDK